MGCARGAPLASTPSERAKQGHTQGCSATEEVAHGPILARGAQDQVRSRAIRTEAVSCRSSTAIRTVSIMFPETREARSAELVAQSAIGGAGRAGCISIAGSAARAAQDAG